MTTLITILKRLASPPAQSLQNFQPTPATVTYTVSTRPVAKTLPATVASYVGIAVRIAIALAGTLALWMKWVVSSRKSLEVVNQVFGRMVEDRLVKGVGEIRGEYMVPVVLCALWFVCKRGYVEESVTVLSGLGLQTSTTSSFYLRTPTTRFIPTTSIQDVFIHEAFKGFEVRFYLAVVVKGEVDVVVVFPRLRPRRAILEDVWRGTRACLFGGGGIGGNEKETSMET